MLNVQRIHGPSSGGGKTHRRPKRLGVFGQLQRQQQNIAGEEPVQRVDPAAVATATEGIPRRADIIPKRKRERAKETQQPAEREPRVAPRCEPEGEGEREGLKATPRVKRGTKKSLEEAEEASASASRFRAAARLASGLLQLLRI